VFPSLEVRWFHEGSVPSQVASWFLQLQGDIVDQPCRVDCYLRLLDRDSLGIKLREGRIEIKQRRRQLGALRFHARVIGLLEHWHKWSFELTQEANSNVAKALVADSSWIGVRKARRFRRYRLSGGGHVVSVSAGDDASHDCALEVTNLLVGGQKWWTLGFEALGQGSAVRENLVLVARHVFNVEEPPALAARTSYGYPGWLGFLAQE
jgi:hypothetical protein